MAKFGGLGDAIFACAPAKIRRSAMGRQHSDLLCTLLYSAPHGTNDVAFEPWLIERYNCVAAVWRIGAYLRTAEGEEGKSDIPLHAVKLDVSLVLICGRPIPRS